MDKDEAELARGLRSVEPPLAFDAEAFAERVVAERSRRRNRRRVCGTSVLAATLLMGLLWQASRETAPVRIAGDSTTGGDALVAGPVSPEVQTDKTLHSDLAEFKQQRDYLDSLLNRIETAKMTMAALRTERRHHLLAAHRAELCKSIVVPDLSPFYRGPVIKPIN